MKIKSTITALALALLTLATACNSNDPDDGDKYFLDIVTLESNGDAGAVMTLQKMGDSPLITLISNQRFNPEEFQAGKRVVIYYHPQSNVQYESGPVTVQKALQTLGEGNPAKESTAEATNHWASAQVQIAALWRTGKYLNIIFQAKSVGEPRQCDLFIDSKTEGAETPNLHLVFEGSPGAMAEYFTFYASYDISKVWDAETTKGIRVYFADLSVSGSDGNSVVITKTTSDLQKPEL